MSRRRSRGDQRKISGIYAMLSTLAQNYMTPRPPKNTKPYLRLSKCKYAKHFTIPSAFMSKTDIYTLRNELYKSIYMRLINIFILSIGSSSVSQRAMNSNKPDNTRSISLVQLFVTLNFSPNWEIWAILGIICLSIASYILRPEISAYCY